MVIPDVDLVAARSIAERVRARFESADVTVDYSRTVPLIRGGRRQVAASPSRS
jgi:hypothetical protein